MTRVAREIGLSNTNFENSSGLPNDDHMSTARDIALLSMAVYKHFPKYWHYFGIKSWTYNGKTYTNGNRLLSSFNGCDGMKTGYTKKSKYSLVATAHRDNRHVMSVILGAENKDVRANVAAQMLTKGFTMLNTGAQPVEKTTYVPPVQSVPVQPVYTQPTYQAPVQSAQTTTFANAYNSATANAMPQYQPSAPSVATGGNGGGAGVQFGAFSSRDAANRHVQNIKNKIGVNTVVEPTGTGMFRVRAYGFSESRAREIKSVADANNIDSYIFH